MQHGWAKCEEGKKLQSRVLVNICATTLYNPVVLDMILHFIVISCDLFVSGGIWATRTPSLSATTATSLNWLLISFFGNK